MGNKRNRLKYFTIQLLAMAAGLFTVQATSNSQEVSVSLPALVFRKKPEMPLRSAQGGLFQDRYCAAYRVAEKSFITSAHCLATDEKNILTDTLEFPDSEVGSIYDIAQNPEYDPIDAKADVAVFKYNGKVLGQSTDFLSLASSDSQKDMLCKVYAMDESFQWRIIPEASSTNCSKHWAQDKICFRAKAYNAGLDFVVLCEENTVLRAMYSQRHGSELQFTDCSVARCWDLIGPSKRSKRQEPTSEAPAESVASTEAVTSAEGAAAAPAEGAAAAPAGGAATAPAPGEPLDTATVPLPPPILPSLNMPTLFPYPELNPVQAPPVPTKPTRRVYFQNPYPGSPTASTMNHQYPDNADKTIVDYEIHGPTDDTPVGFELGSENPANDPTSAPEIMVPNTVGNQTTLKPYENPVVPPGSISEAPAVAGPFPTAPAGDFPLEPPVDGSAPQPIPEIPPPRQPAETPVAYGYPPEDWRFVVTRKPRPRCDPRAGAKPCVGGQQPNYPPAQQPMYPPGQQPMYPPVQQPPLGPQQYGPGPQPPSVPQQYGPYPQLNRGRQCVGRPQCSAQCAGPAGMRCPSRQYPGRQQQPGAGPPVWQPGSAPGQPGVPGGVQPIGAVDPWQIAAVKTKQAEGHTSTTKRRGHTKQDGEESAGIRIVISVGAMLLAYMVNIVI